MDEHTLDANAVAGMLEEIYGAEMTALERQCAHCGNRAAIGTFRVYDMYGPGVVMRCSICSEITLRVVRRPDGSFLVDASGTVGLKP